MLDLSYSPKSCIAGEFTCPEKNSKSDIGRMPEHGRLIEMVDTQQFPQEITSDIMVPFIVT